MTLHSIDPNESVVTSASACPVVMDTSSSHHVSCFEPVPPCVSVLPDLSSVSNTFSTPVTLVNPLRPSNAGSEQKHPNKGLDHNLLHYAPVVTPSPFSMLNYIDRYPDFLDNINLRCMSTNCNKLQVVDRVCERVNTPVAV